MAVYAVAVLCLLLHGPLVPGPAAAQAAAGTVVAIGDIHGAYDELVLLLTRIGLVDREFGWSGGQTILVQTGDFLDRGPDVRRVMDLLMTLETRAGSAGGQVTILLGNHETMNLTRLLRDVSPAAYAGFADGRSEDRRAEAFAEYVDFSAARAAALGQPVAPVGREEWMQAHPPGFIEYLEAFGPSGQYGRWLRARRSIVRIGEALFLHGGLSSNESASSVDEINERTWSELRRWDAAWQHLVERRVILPFFTFDEIMQAASRELDGWITRLWPGPPAPGRESVTFSAADREHVQLLADLMQIGSWSIIDPDGPFWFRGYAQWTDEEGASQIERVLARYGASRVVVGHTIPASFRITPRFDDRVFLIDTGMLSSAYPGGRPSALRLARGEIVAEYLDERVALAEPGAKPDR